MAQPLDKITIKGFKSIRSLEDFKLQPLNVLIGGNGAGKSNFCLATALLQPEPPSTGRPVAVLCGSRTGCGRGVMRGLAAGDEQVGEAERRSEALRVLRQAPAARLGVAEVPLHVREGLLLQGRSSKRVRRWAWRRRAW